jgi:hypothetical protein
METLEQLGVALGLASLAGINLYLTVLIVGVAIRMDWLHMSGSYQHLDVMGHPWVMAVAGVFFVMEFFADKVPWVDSLWDSVHTVIRPVGGTLLALQTLGDMPPYMEVVAALVAGGAALTTHSAKAGSRLLINHSPEPFTNVSMSLAEDAGVVGGMALVLMKPVIAFGVFATLIVMLWLVFPRLFRIIRSTLWLVWNKIRMPGHREQVDSPIELKADLPMDVLGLLAVKSNTAEHDVAWTVECLTGKSKGVRGMRPNVKVLVAARTSGGPLLMVLRGMFRDQLIALPLEGARVETESRLLSDHVVVQTAARLVTLRFPRGCPALLETVAMKIRALAAASTIVSEESGMVEAADQPVELAPLPAL